VAASLYRIGLLNHRMTDFNPLDYPCCLSYPLRLVPSRRAAQVPFAMFLVAALRPGNVVELGTRSGVSYCAFCQAVRELQFGTRCYAIVNGQADGRRGLCPDELLKDLREHHDPLYEGFSTLIESTFDEALTHFEDGAIDLLHIDGDQAYDAVRHDFESWLPKMSRSGVMLFHDMNVRGLGVRQLWEELKPLYPHFEFSHEHGPGLILTGDELPVGLRPLLEASAAQAALIRQFFVQLGQRLKVRLEKAQLAAREQQTASRLGESEAALEELRKELAARERSIEALSTELRAKEGYLRDILNSKAWRWVKRYWHVKQRGTQSLAGLIRRPRLNGRAVPERREIIRQPQIDAAYTSLTLLPGLKPTEMETLLDDSSAVAQAYKADIICFSIIDWEFRYQRPQQLMSQFAAHGHRVFYIRLDHFLPSGGGTPFSVTKLKENLYEIKLAALYHQWVNLEIIERANGEALLDSLDELRRAFHIDEAIGYVQIPSWAHVALAARERWGWHIIYDCMDEWKDFPGLGRSVAEIEPQLVEGCDLLVVTAAALYEKWRTRPRPMVLARNAVDYDFYAEHYRPNTLLNDPRHPVIGYYGAIAGWFDLELMTEVARRRPHYTFVLLGGVFDVDTSALEALANVRLLGQRPYEEMPQYLYHFDVCLIPFKVNSITESTDPVKMYEYLSAGKPVVSVALSELEPFRDYIYLAHDRDDFLAQLDSAVAENDTEKVAERRRFAARNTWPQRYSAIMAAQQAATPRASIIVVAYNNLALTRLCIESILRHTQYLNYELIVVDNNSSDATQGYLRYLAAEHAHIHIILNSENEGFARANNQGVALSTGQYLVLLNNDTVVPPGWLSRLLRHLSDPRVGMVGPLTNFAGNEAGIEVPYRTYAEMLAFAREHTHAHDREAADIRVLAMFCVALRRETYEALGPLDEQFRIGMFEDDDYAQRIRAAGLRVVCAADVFVHHFGQAAFKKLIADGQYDELFDENRRRYETKWKSKWTPHRHGPLKFERAVSSPASSSQTTTAPASDNGFNAVSVPQGFED
jgi:GT2 family glycosyltransferase/glycosyltransferase involved in cell wall biosynthesis